MAELRSFFILDCYWLRPSPQTYKHLDVRARYCTWAAEEHEGETEEGEAPSDWTFPSATLVIMCICKLVLLQLSAKHNNTSTTV